MPMQADRLALLGDTGCQVDVLEIQDCASVEAWPLAAISQAVADAAPDAILMNGDFLYREGACPANAQALCGSSPP
jgi:hypothetical protein